MHVEDQPLADRERLDQFEATVGSLHIRLDLADVVGRLLGLMDFGASLKNLGQGRLGAFDP